MFCAGLSLPRLQQYAAALMWRLEQEDRVQGDPAHAEAAAAAKQGRIHTFRQLLELCTHCIGESAACAANPAHGACYRRYFGHRLWAWTDPAGRSKRKQGRSG